MNSTEGPTWFVESNALLAIIGEDEGAADAMLKDMTESELRTLTRACNTLASMARCEERDRRNRRQARP